eukprot:CAMPEP_0184686344 /NCGR_PEP_ID=MMETSP0312-20130426/22118_1 /TAXON_ID=31354 /ORGANISM="Compsopogon coeruleus, Strain SAG 36.94" /LENGTH=41 /DNA_ID= /DNA_START= /DNA_END= /DNA_ORIENTATION=
MVWINTPGWIVGSKTRILECPLEASHIQHEAMSSDNEETLP